MSYSDDGRLLVRVPSNSAVINFAPAGGGAGAGRPARVKETDRQTDVKCVCQPTSSNASIFSDASVCVAYLSYDRSNPHLRSHIRQPLLRGKKWRWRCASM